MRAFWYGVLCQTADLILPAPTPFKTWLHEKMCFTDEITVLWEDEIWETDLSQTTMTVREAGSPFELLNIIYGEQSSRSLSNDAYRQVSYVNDTGYENAQVLLEYAQNGSKGNTVTGYSFGLWRESYQTTTGNGSEAVLSIAGGSYYYSGTGSVSILTSGETMLGYSYEIGGSMTVYGNAASLSIYTQAASYSYNGEYTHEGLDLQYLRARYLNINTQTFTSKDSYMGTAKDILSQNRYTYAENNPVGNADPSGHATVNGNSKINKSNSVASNLAKKISSAFSGITLSSRINKHGTVNGSDSSAKRILSLWDNIRISNGNESLLNLLNRMGPASLNKLVNASGGYYAFAVEAKRCAAYENVFNELQKRIGVGLFAGAGILEHNSAIGVPTYSWITKEDIICSNEYLTDDEMKINATYIYYKLREFGWSQNAIFAIMGNMQQESTFNPGVWWNLDHDEKEQHAFGLTQWCAGTKLIDWAEERGKDPYDIDTQLEKINEEAHERYGQWDLSKNSQGMTFEEFIHSEEDLDTLTEMFFASYEQVGDNTLGLRQGYAHDWEDYFIGGE